MVWELMSVSFFFSFFFIITLVALKHYWIILNFLFKSSYASNLFYGGVKSEPKLKNIGGRSIIKVIGVMPRNDSSTKIGKKKFWKFLDKQMIAVLISWRNVYIGRRGRGGGKYNSNRWASDYKQSSWEARRISPARFLKYHKVLLHCVPAPLSSAW